MYLAICQQIQNKARWTQVLFFDVRAFELKQLIIPPFPCLWQLVVHNSLPCDVTDVKVHNLWEVKTGKQIKQGKTKEEHNCCSAGVSFLQVCLSRTDSGRCLLIQQIRKRDQWAGNDFPNTTYCKTTPEHKYRMPDNAHRNSIVAQVPRVSVQMSKARIRINFAFSKFRDCSWKVLINSQNGFIFPSQREFGVHEPLVILTRHFGTLGFWSSIGTVFTNSWNEILRSSSFDSKFKSETKITW